VWNVVRKSDGGTQVQGVSEQIPEKNAYGDVINMMQERDGK
jgi:hypothetical protein